MVASIKPHRDETGLTDGQLLIDGTWGPSQSEQTWTHTHPATGEDVASFPIAGPEDVDRAVRAARAAFDRGPGRRQGPASAASCCAGSPTWSGSTATSCSPCRRWTTACR